MIFLTKKCFNAFYGYAASQIQKAKGLNKKINWDTPQRKNILDFVYTFYNQGSTKILNWLDYRSLKQEYCGLVNIPNMSTIRGMYYDWGNYFINEKLKFQDLHDAYINSTQYNSRNIVQRINDGEHNLQSDLHKAQLQHLVNFIIDTYNLKGSDIPTTIQKLLKWYYQQQPIGYRGMINQEQSSDDLRLSAIPNEETPICYISYDKNIYMQHCRKWKEYNVWVKNRNPIRYESNLNKSYDAKNMCECFRLINCVIEIAQGKGFIVDRSNIDAEFLLDVKNHHYEYDELIIMLEEKQNEMNKAIATSCLAETIDAEFVNDLLITFRKEYF